MQKVEMCVGIPACGKSTYAKQIVSKDPDNWVRVNNDDLRAMMNGSVWSSNYEKMVTDTRNYLIRDALKRGKNVIIDNVNINRRHFDDVCKIAKSVNIDVQIYEKPFYIELDEAIERDAKREGKAKVGEQVVRKWFKESGGTSFKFYKPRVEIYKQNMGARNSTVEAPAHIAGLQEAVLCDLDGTLALIHDRSPYDASDCDVKDLPNTPVIETIKAHYHQGRKIIFCSGREDKYRPETIRFIEKYCRDLCNHSDCDVVGFDRGTIQYELFMRKTDDFRKDAIIKEEIYQNEIEGKYNVLLVLDDRNQVVNYWRSIGLTCFQVAPGDF
jgi:predicted kinase